MTTTEEDPAAALHREAGRIRTEMGGLDKLARMGREADKTIRQHLSDFLDPDSFRELGTFSRSIRPEDRASTPGDGKIGGHGTVEGRPVVAFGDDITVRRGSSAVVGTRKEARLLERAMAMGIPIVHFGETGGARIPDVMGAEGISEGGELFPAFCARRHHVPMATAVVGRSFGGSSFLSALSDFVVMVRGTCLAVTSPRVFEVATGEIIEFEDLGGVDIHARQTGQIDLGVDNDEEAYAAIRRWLSFLPSNTSQHPPRSEPVGTLDPDPELAGLVPRRRTRGYDMRKLVARVADPASVFELQPDYARNVTCALGRIDGWPVAFVANNPMFSAGVLDPAACHKIIRQLTVCDSFQIPVVFLVDVPGFMVGKKVEHDRMLHWGMRMMQALHLASVPTLTVCVRKAFGLAWQAMNGSGQAAMGLYVWPGAEIGFMDPAVGVNVAFGSKLARIEDPQEREAERQRLVMEVGEATSPYEAAGTMRVDEVIDPAETRAILAEDLARLALRPLPPPTARPLALWPTC